MMRLTTTGVASLFLTALFLGFLGAAPQPVLGQDSEAVAVQVSPSTLLVNASQGGRVTVHVDIPFSVVLPSSVELNGIPAVSVFADDRGNLVAKFDEVIVKETLTPPSATLVLTGVTKAGEPFCGTDEVQVIVRRR